MAVSDDMNDDRRGQSKQCLIASVNINRIKSAAMTSSDLIIAKQDDFDTLCPMLMRT